MSAKSARAPVNVYHPGPLIDCQLHLDAAITALRASDPLPIEAMLDICGPVPLRRSEPGFAGLAHIILSQQVSVASADATFGRLKLACVPLEAPTLLALEETVLKNCGLSAAKIRALHALARAMTEGHLDLLALRCLSAEVAHLQLVAVKGIGPWTADIFLMFCLGHPDAWPIGDIAMQEAARIIFGLEKRPDARALEIIGERWRPHRAVAARILWAYYQAVKSGRDRLALPIA